MITRGRVSPQRVCDKCGAFRPANTMRVIAGRWICDWHDHFESYEQHSKTSVTTFQDKPFKGAKPLAPRDTYQRAEEELLDFLLSGYRVDFYNLPARTPPVVTVSTAFSSGVGGAAWTGIYLYELIREDLRPVLMISRARVGLKAVADYLLTRIYAYPGRPGGLTDSHAVWGGFATTNVTAPADAVFTVEHSAAAGLALLRAYQVFGLSSYLDAARAAIWFCRSSQCYGRLTTDFVSYDAGGTQRYDIGTWVDTTGIGIGAGTVSYLSTVTPRSLLAMEFYGAFRAAVGDEIIGSPVTGGFFATSREATISRAIADARAFWLTAGAPDSSTGGMVRGFSTTTPRSFYRVFPGGTGSWSTTSAIFAQEWALGLRGLRSVEGDSTDVLSLFDWLMTFSSNPETELPDSYSDKTLWAGAAGTYDPKFCLARGMDANALMNAGSALSSTSSIYDLAAAGLIAGLYSSRQRASFSNLKRETSLPRPRSRSGLEDGIKEFLGPLGRCGFSMQPRSAIGSRFRVPMEAARFGLIYREEPKAFMGRGH